MTEPLRWDDRSGWQMAPRSVWEAGEGVLVRHFQTAEDALTFIEAEHRLRNAKAQRDRYRRQKLAKIQVTIEVGVELIDLMEELKLLPKDAAADRAAQGRAFTTFVKRMAQKNLIR